ncbi:MAG: hypothetical protein ACYTBJ_00175 [Planctomycetota bacterium]|jgi:hypothetical protein
MQAKILINWAPYPTGSLRAEQQMYAFGRLDSLAPDWCEVIIVTLPGEHIPNPVVGGTSGIVLSRHAGDITEGKRLPFMKDILDIAFDRAADRDWGGFFNSDIIVTKEFFDALEMAHEQRHEAIIGHRTDIPTPDTPAEQGRKVNVRKCTDGFFVRKDVWDRLGDTMPDYVLGLPWWDTGTIWWCKMHKLKTVRLTNHEILHVNHGRGWTYKEAGTRYNGKISREMVRNLLGIKGKAKTRTG